MKVGIYINQICIMRLPGRDEVSDFLLVFPTPLAEIIAGYVPVYEFLDWIAPHVLEHTDFDAPAWFGLASNPNAIDMLLGNMRMFPFSNLSDNPNACELLMEEPMQVDWFYASQLPGMAKWLNEHRGFIDYEGLSENPSEIARDLLMERGLDNIDWSGLCGNPSDWAVDIVLANPDRFRFWGISKNTNPRIVAILEKNLEQAFWNNANSNPAAYHLILSGKIDEEFNDLMANPVAIDRIRNHISDDDYKNYNLWSNPAIFKPMLLTGLVELLSGSTVYVSAPPV